MADINPAAFYGIAAVIVAAGLAAVGVKHIFHAALALIATFLGIAALYLLLNAEFLAGAQVLIYVGAIAVLILFAIMLTPDINTRAASHSPRQRAARGLAVFAFALLTGMLLLSQPWKQSLMGPGETDISALAGKLLSGYAFPFEILSLLLLAALIGALLIAKPEKEN